MTARHFWLLCLILVGVFDLMIFLYDGHSPWLLLDMFIAFGCAVFWIRTMMRKKE